MRSSLRSPVRLVTLIARRKDDEVLREKIFQELFSRQLVMGFDVGRIAARVPNFKGL